MLRNDGEELPVKYHPYGNYNDDWEETALAAEWLYNHTQYDNVKKLVINFIHAWAIDGEPEADINNLIRDTIDYINAAGYEIITEKFLKDHEKEIVNSELYELKDLNDAVCNALDQEFTRVRFGGMYDTNRYSKELVFRISSVNFNWFDLIWNYVYKYRSNINSVTIARDHESTGEDYFYSHNGVEIVQMPVEEFITLSGKPLIEEFTNKDSNLSLLDLYRNMPLSRMNEKIHIAKDNKHV